MGHIYGEWSGRNQVHPSSKTDVTGRPPRAGGEDAAKSFLAGVLGSLPCDMPLEGWNDLPSGFQGNLCPTLRASVTTPWLQRMYVCQTDAHGRAKNGVDSHQYRRGLVPSHVRKKRNSWVWSLIQVHAYTDAELVDRTGENGHAEFNISILCILQEFSARPGAIRI